MANPREQFTDLASTEDRVIIGVADGRSISVPVAWFSQHRNTTSKERENQEIAEAGAYGRHWPNIDENLSVEGLIYGAPGPAGKH